MTAFLHSARRFAAGLAGWKLPILLAASLLLNLGFVLVWVLQPLPSALGPRAGAGGVPEENSMVSGATLEARLRAAGYSEAEVQKVAGAAGTRVALANRSATAEAGQAAPPASDSPRPNRAGPTGGNRAISIGSTGANPTANRAASAIQSRSFSPTLRGSDASAASAPGAARTPNSSSAPAPLASPDLDVAPMMAAPGPSPVQREFPHRELLTPEQQLYRSLYGWQDYNAAITESASEANPP